MFEIILSPTDTTYRRRVIGTADTFEEAKALAGTLRNVCHMEDDSDFPGCADAYCYNGDLLAIQPVGFTMKATADFAKASAYGKVMQDAAAAFDADFLKGGR